MTLLCLHDADPYGYNIGAHVAGGHRGLPESQHQRDRLGPGTTRGTRFGSGYRTIHPKEVLPAALKFNEIEKAYFTGEEKWQDGKRVWQCQRIELNALAKNPDEFIAWIVAKLTKHGLNRKLVPPRERIAQRSEFKRQKTVATRVATCISAIIGMDKMVDSVTRAMCPNIEIDKVPDEVAEWAAAAQAGIMGALRRSYH